MKIETKLNIGDTVYFMTTNKVRESVITDIDVNVKNSNIDVTYTVKDNPAGTQYSRLFQENKIFKNKEDLLASLWD